MKLMTAILSLMLISSTVFAANNCYIQAVGDRALAVYSDGERVSELWERYPEYAYDSLKALQDIGYCAASKPRSCKIQAVGDRALAVYSNGQRISTVWDDVPEYAYDSLRALQKLRYCK